MECAMYKRKAGVESEREPYNFQVWHALSHSNLFKCIGDGKTNVRQKCKAFVPINNICSGIFVLCN